MTIDNPTINYANGIVSLPPNKVKYMSNECYQVAGEWGFAAINTGTATAGTTVDINHPGVLRLASSTSANSGYRINQLTSSILIGGGEIFNVIFNNVTSADTIVFMGFHNSISQADPADGVYAKIIAGTLTGVAANNSTRTNTGTTYACSNGVWYRLNAIVNSTSLVTFTLYDCATGASLWTNTVTTNIPTARTTGHAIVAIYTPAGAATSIIDVDFFDMYVGSLRPLVR